MSAYVWFTADTFLQAKQEILEKKMVFAVFIDSLVLKAPKLQWLVSGRGGATVDKI